VLVALFGWGCLAVPGGIAPSTTPIDGRDYLILGAVSQSDSRIRLFGVIPVTGANRIQEAVDDCLRAKAADALINVTVDAYFEHWIVFSREVTKVNGTAIRFK